MTPQEQALTNSFHDLFYNGPEGETQIYMRTYWMGYLCLKCPLDLWTYQEIIAELRPDQIIETGTYKGGSALFLAQMLDLIGQGEVITIDTWEHPDRPVHPRIKYVFGSSADPALIAPLLRQHPARTRLIILDSDHSQKHVAAELKLLAPYVTPGSYLIVEDTNINGHPTFPDYGPGPFEAVAGFLASNADFVADAAREKFLLTFNPRGYLQRIR